MKLNRNKIFSFMLAAAFALTLAGCGGGGGTAAVEEPPAMPDPTPQEMCEGDGGRYNADGSCSSAAEVAEEMALSGAQSAASAAAAAMAAVGAAVDPVAAHNAYGYASMAKTASDAAAMATTSEIAMTHQMAAETAQMKAEEAAGTRGLGITQLANKITNQSAIDNAALEGRDPVKAVSNATRVGTALTASATGPAGDTPAAVQHTTVDDTGTPPNTPGGSVTQGGTASAEATYNAAGPRFTVMAGTGEILRGENPTSLMTSGEKPTGGWPGAELVRTDDTPGKTYVLAFTDVEASTTRQNYGTTTAGAADVGTNAAELAIGQIITGDIPGDGSTFTGTRNVSDDDNLPAQAGRFFCDAGAACAISVDEDGVIVAVEGYGWQPIDSGTTPTSDTDYMAWGVWLTVPDGTAAADVATAGAFGSGNDVFTVMPALKGTATYNGDASGLYSAGGMVEYFDADVSLTANFGGTEGADSTPGSAAAETDNDGRLMGMVTGTGVTVKCCVWPS